LTVLSVCQDASIELGQPYPNSVFSSTSPFARELQLQVKRAAAAIAKAYDWQELTQTATLTGDGTTTAFDMPADFDRTLKTAKVHSSSLEGQVFTQARDYDHWLYITDTSISGTPGFWIIQGAQMNIWPAMAVGETARFYYVSKYPVVATDGTTYKETFTADTDVFRLSEKTLALGLAWRWRAMKQLDFQAFASNYELALSEDIGRNRGPKVLVAGRIRSNADEAFNGVLGGPGGNTLDADGWTLDED
jgi:hypothetical protein